MYTLTGLAEGLAGAHQVQANSLAEVFAQFPALHEVREKLVVTGRNITGFAACDG